MSTSTHVSFNRTDLINAIEIARLHAATEDNRPVLNRVNFLKQDNAVYVVGADGYRMSLTKLEPSALDFVDCGVDLSDVKALLKHLKSLKRESEVSFVVSNEELTIQVPEYKRVGGYNSYTTKATGVMVDSVIDIQRISVAGFEVTSTVGKFPSVFNLLPRTNNLSARVNVGAELHTLYNPNFELQNVARLEALKALGKASKSERENVDELYRVTKLTLQQQSTGLESSAYYNSSSLHDSFKALESSDESTTLQIVDGALYIKSESSQFLIMPRNPSYAKFKPEQMHSINFVLYA